jgi:hypothetical protein
LATNQLLIPASVPEILAEFRKCSVVEKNNIMRVVAPRARHSHSDMAFAALVALGPCIELCRSFSGPFEITTGRADFNSSRYGVHLVTNRSTPRTGVHQHRQSKLYSSNPNFYQN